ncbi:sister chromatid cohesion protein PDS5 homolog C isoform X1 [Rosa rugosa]|uniref:sister chromatid cohesion protein PDS5 homolog C isoform X1 n=1 Tax=Rosa rugosa TaxID=74645 RepID=UPI002B418290|nr:sister chromatid cohesion protein PDS5 homolog C isoform X1 [Rosa rugosa]
MASTDNELEAQLLEAGNQLLEPPSTVDDLLPLLDRVESCLSKVEQSPNKSMQAALSPSQKALVADQLLRHSDPDVKVSVASCISEITRITAPDAPYDDDQMKEVFQLIVSSFENLDDKCSRSYTKRTSILETVAKVRSCVVMLDLECDALIVEMFQHFLKAIRDYHPENVFSSMETIMTLVIEESEDISFELLSPLLASVKNDDEDILPISRKLGERVIENSAIKLKPHLAQEVETHGIALGDYSKVVASICQETAGDTEQNEVHDDEDVEDKSTIRESSEEAVQDTLSLQVDKENSTAAVSSEQVDTVIDGSSKVVLNNGGAATGEDECSADLNSLKKQEQGEDTEEVKGPNTSSVAEPDSLETEKAVDAKQMPEEVSEDKDKDSNLSTAQPADSPQADNEEETEALPPHKSGSEDAPGSPHEVPDVEAAVPSENEKGSDINLSTALEKESTDVAPPSPSGSLPDESRPKKAGRHKKKDTSNKEATPVTDDESKKATDGTSDSELRSSKHSGKKVSAGGSNENKSPIVVDASRKESGTASDSEVKQKSSKKVSTGNSKENNTSVVVDAPRKESSSTSDSEARQKLAKKVDGSNKTSDESSLKQPEDKKKRARSKVSSRRSSTKSSAMEVDKEILSTPKSKSTKNELPLEETPKTNSKRKRPSEKEKQSGVKEFDDTEVIGSKIKVWWPADRMYYKGVVHSFDSVKKKHVVKYNDGDQEILNLKREKWLYVEGDSESDGEQENDESSHDGSSELPLKKKAKSNRDGSTKKEKMDATPKSGGGASSSKSKGRTTKSGRKQRDSSKPDGRSKGDTSKAVGKTDDDCVGKLKDQTPKSGGKSVDVAQKTSSKSKNNESQTPKSSKSKEDDSNTQRVSIKSKQDMQKAGKSNQGTPKTSASTPKGKSSLSSSKANGKVKSGSKARESEDMEEDSTDSEKAPERTKGKSTSSSKAQGSQTKSGKKRRRGTKS